MDTHTTHISTAIILAAGKGTRMGLFTQRQPKCLVPLHDMPLLGHACLALRASGIDRIIVVTEYLHDQVEAYVRTLPFFVECVQQSKRVGEKHGTAAAVMAAMPSVVEEQAVLVVSGDSLYSIEQLQQLRQSSQAVMCVAEVESVFGFGEVQFDRAQRVLDILEKPQTQHAGYVNAGAYACPREMLNMVSLVESSTRGEYEFTDVIRMYNQQAGVYVQLLKSTDWTTVTTADDIVHAEYFLTQHI